MLIFMFKIKIIIIIMNYIVVIYKSNTLFYEKYKKIEKDP